MTDVKSQPKRYTSDASNQRVYSNITSGGVTTETFFFYGADGKKLGVWTIPSLSSTFTLVSLNTWFGGRLLKPQDRLNSIGKYFPYGEDRYNPSPANPPNGQEKFATYTRDAETGLDYAYQRYYTAGLGRFMTPDPLATSASITSPQTQNRYPYASNDPTNNTDPGGTDPYCGPTGTWMGEGCYDSGGGSTTSSGSSSPQVSSSPSPSMSSGYDAISTTSFCAIDACTTVNIANSANSTYNPYAIYATILGKSQLIITGSLMGTISGDFSQAYSEYKTYLTGIGSPNYASDSCIEAAQAASDNILQAISLFQQAQSASLTYGGWVFVKPPAGAPKGSIGYWTFQLTSAVGTPFSTPPSIYILAQGASTASLSALSAFVTSQAAAAFKTAVTSCTTPPPTSITPPPAPNTP